MNEILLYLLSLFTFIIHCNIHKAFENPEFIVRGNNIFQLSFSVLLEIIYINLSSSFGWYSACRQLRKWNYPKKKKLKTCVFKSAVVLGNSSGSSCNHSTQICLSWEVGSYNTWKIRSLRYSWFIKAVHGSSLSSINPMEFGREGNTVTGEMPVCIFFPIFSPNPLNHCENERGKNGVFIFVFSAWVIVFHWD